MGLNNAIKSLEPLWWSLFGLGGAIAAFLLPAHIIIQGILIPAGILPQDLLYYDRVAALISHPIVKIYFLAIICFPLYHAAPRTRMTLEDLRIHWLESILPILCYGGATALSVLALIVIFIR